MDLKPGDRFTDEAGTWEGVIRMSGTTRRPPRPHKAVREFLTGSSSFHDDNLTRSVKWRFNAKNRR